MSGHSVPFRTTKISFPSNPMIPRYLQRKHDLYSISNVLPMPSLSALSESMKNGEGICFVSCLLFIVCLLYFNGSYYIQDRKKLVV